MTKVQDQRAAQRAAKQTKAKAPSKHCKHCYSTIHKRARVCPVCQNKVTYSGRLSSLFLTGFPIMTTILSLGFALFEKYEKELVVAEKREVQVEKKAVEEDLGQAELDLKIVRTEVEAAEKQMSSPPPVRAMSAIRMSRLLDREPLLATGDGPASDAAGSERTNADEIRESAQRERLIEETLDQARQRIQGEISEKEAEIRKLAKVDFGGNREKIVGLQGERFNLKIELNSLQ